VFRRQRGFSSTAENLPRLSQRFPLHHQHLPLRPTSQEHTMDDNIGIALMSVSHTDIRPTGDEEHSEIEAAPETAPLLANEALQGPHSNSSPGAPSSSHRLSSLIFYFMMIHFLLAFCDIILNAPLQRLFENSLCLKYYHFPESGVPEETCKISEVQYNLAILRGWKSMFDNIPG
jgi:hypothetical protein